MGWVGMLEIGFFGEFRTVQNHNYCINNYLEFKISTLAAKCHLGHHLLKHHPSSMENLKKGNYRGHNIISENSPAKLSQITGHVCYESQSPHNT